MMLPKTALLASWILLNLTTITDADIITYDASSGLLPQDAGWTYTDRASPPANAGVSGGILTLDSGVGNRARWDLNPVPGTPGNDGMFMEATMRVIGEQHTPADRGVTLPHVGHADGVIESGVDLYAWEDRIFLNDFDDITVGTHFMDTTDALHAYRIELLRTRYWVFVDDNLVLSGMTQVNPSSSNGVVGGFGDGSRYSGGITEWTKITIGSLADVGGPTIPEPSTLILSAFAILGLAGYGWRRRLRQRIEPPAMSRATRHPIADSAEARAADQQQDYCPERREQRVQVGCREIRRPICRDRVLVLCQSRL